MRALVWFRNDLRLEDNVVLHQAVHGYEEVYCLYCFDQREFADTPLGFPRTSTIRAKFMLESVESLKADLGALGNDLIVREGYPSEVVPEVAQILNADHVLATQAIAFEEKQIEKEIKEKLAKAGKELKLYWQSTLFHWEDLPFPLEEIPEVFTAFRKLVEKKAQVRSTYPKPTSIPSKKVTLMNENVRLVEFALATRDVSKAVMDFHGGEGEGRNRLDHYFWKSESLSAYKETRNGLLGADYSSKFSPWLAMGCLSPRFIYEEVRKYEKKVKKNSSTYWLIFELIWRDYFYFITARHGRHVFMKNGIKRKRIPSRDHVKVFERWCRGETGQRFIDANMKELNATGFMSNRGRQNVASYLIHDLNINWTWGAWYFESKLIDYDPCSNWCNWNYLAGVGNDPRDRYFNVEKQAAQYDPDGKYVSHWLG